MLDLHGLIMLQTVFALAVLDLDKFALRMGSKANQAQVSPVCIANKDALYEHYWMRVLSYIYELL